MNVIDQIAGFVNEHAGFETSGTGRQQLIKAIERRTDPGSPLEDYLLKLRSSPAELRSLLEDFVVPETFFFRYEESFRALTQWARQHKKRPLRILSAACSTGEEPYSIAFSLLEAGWKPRDFHIEAFDLSEPAIQTARAGVYRSNSFRGEIGPWQERFFENAGEGWRVRSQYLDLIDFRRSNLLLMEDVACWDAIFCRNVMIYFDNPSRQRVSDLLHRALLPGGMLFLGPAEPAAMSVYGWRTTGLEMSFTVQASTDPAMAPSVIKPKPITLAPRRRAIGYSAPRFMPDAAPPEMTVEDARKLADQGRVQEARDMLRRVLAVRPDDAAGRFLLGLIEESLGNIVEAEAQYRQTLYLEPAHQEAMHHMALLLRKQGRTDAAGRFERRVSRRMPS
ncbi:chemotaxis protein methyltransferase WspC [Terrimicrobium sacchariphilum]|jgi:chemotaxis protein methyltransferase WspC|uniref:Chemotaxis protein methyltransferase WspC n=1 Tax=Terrimicrobium sacchariphilum TaxID=690879 RepID=A0A146GBR6_TERSA|nr:protein-glutamate O-methyltransferase CheR [Terrimicrobium sacchariphilum]GAT35049.1 chemotaxis protein methyltransferase WspC [Terrimicrobium sacchariphilum]